MEKQIITIDTPPFVPKIKSPISQIWTPDQKGLNDTLKTALPQRSDREEIHAAIYKQDTSERPLHPNMRAEAFSSRWTGQIDSPYL